MAPPPRAIRISLLGTFLLLNIPASFASAEEAGGVLAEPGKTDSAIVQEGGAEYGSSLRKLPGRPQVRVLRLAQPSIYTGSRANLVVDVRRRAARSARVRITIDPRRGRTRRSVRRVRTGKITRLLLPKLARGHYAVRVTVLAGAGERPLPGRRMRLVVERRPRPRPAPLPPAAPDTPARPAPTLPVAPVVINGGVFPVQGAHSFGGSGSKFGAGRVGHIHEGHDISAASGTPVVAPLAGEILFNDYQASGAGRYIVLRADNGWDMFFAHLLAGSATLDPGARVTIGQRIGLVGSTGGSSGPHLHFEIWPSGWRHLKGTRPIDPLPQLRAWAG